MLYLLDSNVIIRAHEDYYPIDRIPQFWDWLVAEGSEGHAKIPLEIYDEITPATGPLKTWITSSVVKHALILAEEVDRLIFNQVLDAAYAPDLTEDELEGAGGDPFLVAYGLMGEDRVVVTKETPRPSQKRGRRKLPDACDAMHVLWMPDFHFYRERNFRIP